MQEPLVSIIVVAYNSSLTIIETLESAKSQFYSNIELIVSDDCSTDNTVELCRVWIEANKERFVRTQVLTCASNSGISQNLNRGIKASSGEWVKLIAGDDVLKCKCIDSNINFIQNNPDAKAVFSYCERFRVEAGSKQVFSVIPSKSHAAYFNISPEKQYRKLLDTNFVWVAPAVFLNTKLLIEVNYFDERFPYIDDYPMWLKLTKNNVPLLLFDEITVEFRLGESTTKGKKKWVSPLYLKKKKKFFESEIFEELKKRSISKYVKQRVEILQYSILLNAFNNKKTMTSKLVSTIFDVLKAIL